MASPDGPGLPELPASEEAGHRVTRQVVHPTMAMQLGQRGVDEGEAGACPREGPLQADIVVPCNLTAYHITLCKTADVVLSLWGNRLIPCTPSCLSRDQVLKVNKFSCSVRTCKSVTLFSAINWNSIVVHLFGHPFRSLDAGLTRSQSPGAMKEQYCLSATKSNACDSRNFPNLSRLLGR